MTRKQKHLLTELSVGIGTTLFLLALSWLRYAYFMHPYEKSREGFLGLIPALELAALDFRFQKRNEFPRTAPVGTSDIVIIAIDNQSLNPDVVSEPMKQFPWPRSTYARVIDKLTAAGAKAIGLDIEFSSPGAAGPQHDEALADAMKRANNVILVSTITSSKTEHADVVSYNTPIQAFAEACAGYGLTYLEPDRDNVFRRIYLRVPHPQREEMYPAFAVKILQVAEQRPRLESSEYFLKEILHAPTESCLVNFCRPQEAFTTYSFYQVHDDLLGELENKVKGKIVLIGPTAVDLQDLRNTPIHPLLAGIEYHANTIHTVLTKSYIWQYPAWMEVVFSLGMGLLASALMMQFSALIGSLLVVAGVLIFSTVITLLFMFNNLWLPMMTPVLCGMGSFTGLLIFRYATEGREKKKIRQMFSRYVSQQVVEEILKNPDQISLVGRNLKVTVLFSDIRSFTTISESLTPEQVVEQLNEYFTEMVDVVMLYGGTLDKFIGDAVMAVFGSPLPRPDDAYRAVQAAFEMQKRLEGLRQKWATEGKPAFHIGIGLNTGDAIVGNLGSAQKMEYTVIGDTVNVASRLESLTKEHKAKILIGEGVFAQVGDKFETRLIGEVTVKGKTKGIDVYEVLGTK